ncbi:uncharacterized protein J4E84_006308 [Alternaria hordeiaustralica]|uniref:uncharacterized protein n=1 Tax=Alternaria hordeiaustralica TaxID=1187925 RepID=UPI0020C54280|nr:uncharacterized protein J4E84_006308 [Alternaria hordeiaustralica]KAI4684320.1 hypothetical protein J4E84_006308 [Alternaria hordeiaustralica]
MSSRSFLQIGVAFLVFFTVRSTAQRHLDVPWSDKKYGPDGPWQAVRVTFGGNDTNLKIGGQNHADVDVYPGGTFESFVFSRSACDPFPDSACGEGGTWEPEAGATSFIPANGWHPTVKFPSFGLVAGPANYTDRALTIGGATVWNASIMHTNSGNITAFDGKTSGLRLGYLGLGAAEQVQTFSVSDSVAGHDVSLNVYNGKLYKDGIIGSYSYLLHIGSAAFDYPGSLVFGGYNKGRVIGPPTSFRDQDKVDLLDIGIGVEYGESPFEVDSISNLLVADTGETGKAQQVIIDPRNPYLSLPDNTCEGLAKVLPIKYDPTTKYFLWKTDDPNYTKIVTSPAYLSFTFPPGSGASLNVTIKVPFALLNLTLDTPIVEKPTPYFPCHSYTPTNDEDRYRLGRAFLQAAYVGRNWASQITWLGQAPGPGFNGQGLGDQLTDIADGATTLDYWDSEKTNYFNQSWAGHWSVVESVKPNSPNDTDVNTTGSHTRSEQELSTAAKAGIGIGAALGGIAIIAVILFLCFRRKHNRKVVPDDGLPTPQQHAYGSPMSPMSALSPMPAQYGQPEKKNNEFYSGTQEMYTAPVAQELPDSNDVRHN